MYSCVCVDMLLATEDDYQRISESRERRPCPTTSCGWARGAPVALTLTALAPEIPRDLLQFPSVSRFTVNKKAQT